MAARVTCGDAEVHVRLVAAVLMVGLAGCVDVDAPVNPGDDTDLVFEVPKGATARSLRTPLADAGFAVSDLQWRLVLREVDGSCLKAGKFRLVHSMSFREVLDTLCGPPIPDDVPFTVVEGMRIQDIDDALVAKGWIEPGAYAKLATTKTVDAPFDVPSPTLEGYLYPETYMVSPAPFDPARLIVRQLETFEARFLSKHPDGFGERSLHDVVVMASLLEREEPNPENRKVVAGILWKRLDNGWQLGVDATSHYKLAEWNDRRGLLAALKDPDDPYNTRIHHGLPPTAIGSASAASLEAALEPVSSPFWFYLHDKNGTFHGGRDAAEHDRNRARYNVY